jgi:Na+/phosphate symporter
MTKNIRPEVPIRRLVYIPIVHTHADMGALRESVRQVALRKLGKTGWERKLKVIDKMWTQIEQVIDSLALQYEKVRLYQDGLPVCGREIEIVTELAKAGSRNHQILLRLLEKGATIMGTESSELLVEEYELVKQILATGDTSSIVKMTNNQKALSESLLRRRDQYIADRINKTLRAGETGIIFLGLLHALGRWLDKDIQVIYPVGTPFPSRLNP